MSLADFKIINKLGSGAYSSVYKVQRILDNQIYALKKVNLTGLNQKQKQNSLNQIRILASIRNNYVIGYRQAFFDQNTKSLCIIMQFADNGDLFQKITEKSQKKLFFTQEQVWKTFIQIVKGLKSLHDRKILHRDLKSANVFLTKDGTAKLGDMNVSKISQKGLCQTQTGTPYYASPQVWKDQSYGPKSDIWSLGCVIYEMMALKPPFQAEDMQGLYKRVIKGDYSKLPLRYSSDLNDLIRILLQTDPYKRPSCQKILSMKMVVKRMNQQLDQSYENPQFLRTIKMPKNIYVLTQNLPKPNYFSSKKQLRAEKQKEKNRIIANQTQKFHKKSVDSKNNSKLFPKLNNKQIYSHNKSVLLKNTSIIQAARNEVQNIAKQDELSPNQPKIDLIVNGSINNRKSKNVLKDLMMKQVRDKRIRKQKNIKTYQEQVLPNKATIDMASKISQIQKIYGDNSLSKIIKKRQL